MNGCDISIDEMDGYGWIDVDEIDEIDRYIYG